MTLNEKQIQAIVDKHGISRTEVEELIKTNDFTENRDFTDDSSAYNYNLLRELADSWKSFTTEKDPEKSRRAHQLFRELFEDIKAKLNELDTLKKKKSDFTDDKGTPVVNELIRLMDRIYFIVVKQETRLIRQLESMSDAEADRVYKHKFIREFQIDLIP